MTSRFSERLNRRRADRALDGSGTSGVARVDEILAAATAPPSGFELNREADTVAMFRATVASTAAADVKITTMQAIRLRLAATKLAVAGTAAVLLAGGGVAYAASTGHLPEILGGDNRSDNGSNHSSQAPGQQATRGPQGPKGALPPGATPNPSLNGLCKAFQAGAASNPGKAAENPAFSALATAAGGQDNIAAYCTFLIGEPGSSSSAGPKDDKTHPVHPTHPANPNKPDKPAKTPTDAEGSNDPTSGPTKKPHPTHPAHPTNGANATKTPKR